MRRKAAPIAVLVLLGVAAAAYVALRSPTLATSVVDPDVTIECAASASVSAEACGAWGDEILGLGPPSATFEMEDLSRLAISGPLLGLGSSCRVEYFLQRYPDDAVWTEDIPCGGVR